MRNGSATQLQATVVRVSQEPQLGHGVVAVTLHGPDANLKVTTSDPETLNLLGRYGQSVNITLELAGSES